MNRRDFVKTAAAAGGLVAAGALSTGLAGPAAAQAKPAHGQHVHPGGISVRTQAAGLKTPMEFLRHFDYGTTSVLPGGRTLREYDIVSHPADLEVAKGVVFPAWTFNGSVPGPTLRATEGDRVRIRYRNADRHPHTIHFHGIHPAGMDGVFEPVGAGEEFVYEFDAEPFGVHPYHCHVLPLTKHVAKGLYGTFVVDPPLPREAMTEMVMVMNGFDVDFDGENEFYTVNGIANYYFDNPIPIRVGEKVRIYLVNMTEFDLVNSFHLHANLFKFFPTGTRLDAWEFTDTIMMCQGERGILEFAYKHPGKYLFHAHQSEFAELGWTGMFEVSP